jgi:uncharacterized protein (TIGR03118 family)
MMVNRSRVFRLLGGPLLAAAVSLATSTPAFAAQGSYAQDNLVSDVPGLAHHTDGDLVNAWGLARSATSPWWVSDNGTDKSTLYDGSGATPGLIVTIPPSGSGPTGVVFNGGTGFVVSNGTKSGASLFIFATESGTIAGWSPGVDLTHAIVAVPGNGTAVYKGLAIGVAGGATFLYATNFRAGTIDVFDSKFQAVTTLDGNFTDRGIHAGFSPFGIANLNGDLYVTYAKRNAAGHDDVAGPANGYVDVFDTSGHMLRRAATRGRLNSPWGVAIAPSNFGPFSGDLLVGNFGDGRINAVDPATGEFLGQLRDADNRPITIDGLWALAFGGGPTSRSGPRNSLFFTAGPNGEKNGLFGVLTSRT